MEFNVFNFIFFSFLFLNSKILFFLFNFFPNGHIDNGVSTLIKVVKLDVEKNNIVLTLFKFVSINVGIDKVVSTFNVANLNVDRNNVVSTLI